MENTGFFCYVYMAAMWMAAIYCIIWMCGKTHLSDIFYTVTQSKLVFFWHMYS